MSKAPTPILYDREKVATVLHAQPLGARRLLNVDTGEYCALGALAHAAGVSNYTLLGLHAYEATLGPVLEREYGIPGWMVPFIWTVNDRAWPAARAEAVLQKLDRLCTLTPQEALEETAHA